MPLPGNAMTALRQQVQEVVVAAERCGPSVAVPVRFVNICLLSQSISIRILQITNAVII